MNEHSIEICFGGIKLSILDDDKSLKKVHLVKNKSFNIINYDIGPRMNGYDQA
jgi:hypothetical protein